MCQKVDPFSKSLLHEGQNERKCSDDIVPAVVHELIEQ